MSLERVRCNDRALHARGTKNVRLVVVASLLGLPHTPRPSTTVSLNQCAADDRMPGMAGLAPAPPRGGGTWWRWSPARAAQDARGAPRGMKRLGTRGAWRKDRGSGGKCASRSAARNAYAAMQSE